MPLSERSFVDTLNLSEVVGCCSPRLQTRGFSLPLATKPSPLKRRATNSLLPSSANEGFNPKRDESVR
jgi:hypothetical protein